ncbi:glycosyltransferase [Kiritimatiella glycovorans]|uniref:Mannosylfructose-phosphate synthase n=1 Tax=Kiritimatiella glycovorans TaxID=1307763 RepID=A0A0G3EI09_9BACT|nr:glycosyltransferase [Kiritimatiella glycovorans]AKJ64445.1 Mannosylfructose-phosphate synthase [Kiritimatiella glycovorans]
MRMTHIMLSKGFGGAERSFVDTALAMSARGHEVQAVCHPAFKGKEKLEGIRGVRVAPVRVLGDWDRLAVRRIRAKLKAFRPSAVHTQLRRAAKLGGRAAAGAGVPVVAKLHNYADLSCYRDVDVLIGTTRHQVDYAREHDWPEDRLRLIPNFSRVPAVEEARVREARTARRLLSYGRYVPKKGFDLLLRAFAALVEEGRDLQLTLGGGGPEQDALSSLARKLGVSDRVRLGVWIDDVSSALDQADLFVLPSRDEPFGIVMLEAMARGIPIVTTKTRGPSEVLADDSAFFASVDSADSLLEAMRTALENPGDAVRRAQCALEWYRRRYCEEAVIPQIEALYRVVAVSES